MHIPFQHVLRAGIVAAWVLAVAQAAWAQSPSTAPLPVAPRAVVYDLGTLDTLHTLGIPVAGVPKAQLPDYLTAYGGPEAPVAGSLFEPDYDALSRIQPELIVVGGRSAAKAEVLQRIAPTLDASVRPAHLVDDIVRNVRQIAQLYGKSAEGEALVAQIQHELAELRALAAQAAPGVLLMAVNERLMPQAPGSRFGFLFEVLGAKSLLTASDLPARGGPPFTFDDLATLQPQWIYVIDRNTGVGSAAGGGAIVPSQQVFANAQVQATPAGQKGQIVFLDPKGWYLMGSSGPTALLRNIAQLQQAYRAARAP